MRTYTISCSLDGHAERLFYGNTSVSSSLVQYQIHAASVLYSDGVFYVFALVYFLKCVVDIWPAKWFGTTAVSTTLSQCHLGVLFDETLCLSPHVSNICKSVIFQLRQISRIRDFLTKDATKTIVHSLVTSRLDYSLTVARARLICAPQLFEMYKESENK